MNMQQFDRLLDLYLQGRLSPEMHARLEKWLDQYGDDDLPDDRTEEEKEALRQRILQKTSRQGGKVVRMTVYRVAASILLVAVTSYMIWNVWFRQAAMNMVTSLGVTTKHILKDGSIVWLKGESSLAYADNFTDERYVILKGEALFEVARDPSRPFTIDCGDVTTQVLGTSFNIKTKEDNNIEVLVLTGKVKVSSPDNEQGIAVLPNEKAIYYDKEELLVKENAKEAEATTAVAGTEYNMHFEDEPVRDVLERIEKKFDVSFVMEDNSKLDKCRFTADLTDQTLEWTLALMVETLKFEYTVEGRNITVKGGLLCE